MAKTETLEPFDAGEGAGEDAADLVRRLVSLGLTTSEARVYLTLLRSSDLTATQTADKAGVARPKVYEALRTLEERGFCVSLAARTTRFRATSPQSGLTDLLHQREHERQLVAERDQELVRELIERLPEPTQAPPIPGVAYLEAVFGRARTSAALERVISGCRDTLLMMQQPPFLQPRGRWNLAEVAAIKRGATMRIIYSRDAIADPERYVAVVEAGAEARVADELPMKLCLCDGREAMLSLRDPVTHEQGLTSIVVRHPDLAGALALVFETQWDRSQPLAEALAA